MTTENKHIRLSPIDIARATNLGAGNMTAGLRIAINLAEKAADCYSLLELRAGEIPAGTGYYNDGQRAGIRECLALLRSAGIKP